MSAEFRDGIGRPDFRLWRKILLQCSRSMFERRRLRGSISSTSGQTHVDKPACLFALASTLPVQLLSAAAEEDLARRLAAIEFPLNQPVAFVEHQFNRLLREPMEQRGVVWLEGEGTMVMRVHLPRLEERRIEQSQLVIRRPSHPGDMEPDQAIAKARARYRKLDLQRGGHLALWAAVQVLSGNAAAIHAHFAVSSTTADLDTTQSQDSWSIQLTPHDRTAQRALPFMRLYGNDDRLERVYIAHGASQWRDIQFLNDMAEASAPPDES